MRLGQMARKMAISPSEIIQFLASKEIFIDDNANFRLEDSQVELLLRKFAPSLQLDAPAAIAQPVPGEAIPEPSLPLPEPLTSLNAVEEMAVEESNELIKAPRIALSGLKVLGKIELPEPKKKEEEAPAKGQEGAVEISSLSSPVERTHNKAPKKTVQYQGKYKNPVALKRERETEEEQERRKQKATEEKERKTQSYLKKVKLSPPTKAMRLVEEPVMQMTNAELKEAPKSWWNKFVKWIST
ncbi:MAG: hypothetical protein WKF87_17200 [Chryseolinea sp.]